MVNPVSMICNQQLVISLNTGIRSIETLPKIGISIQSKYNPNPSPNGGITRHHQVDKLTGQIEVDTTTIDTGDTSKV
jgi:hypothetical protein